jgi:hypothetical protein
MQLSQISPEMQAFAGASTHYQHAIETITSPVELPFPVLADQAKGDVAKAVELLTPFAASGQMFTSRNAGASIGMAKEAVAMLDQLANATADTGVTIDQVVGKLSAARTALWWE